MQREPQFEAAKLEAVTWDDPHGRTPLVAQLDPQTAVERGLRKPSECDVLVGIFWARMGSPLPIEKWQKADGSAYLSGTEYELDDAFANPGLDVLLYRRSEEPRWGARDPKRKDNEEQFDRIETYVAFLKAAHRYVNEYPGPSDFKDHLKNDLRKILARRLKNEHGEQSTAPTKEVIRGGAIRRGSPYPGLRSFAETEAPVFFGRGAEIDALLRKARQSDSRFVAVIGSSGSGKSSLVRAGIIPRLRSNALKGSKDWVILIFKPGELGDDPFLPLAIELQRILPPHKQQPTARTLAERLAKAPEEIVTLGLDALPMTLPPEAPPV